MGSVWLSVSVHGEVLLKTRGGWKVDEAEQKPGCCGQAGTCLCVLFAQGPARHCSGRAVGAGAGLGQEQGHPGCFPLLLPGLPAVCLGRGIGELIPRSCTCPRSGEISSECSRKDSSRIWSTEDHGEQMTSPQCQQT